MLVYGPIAAELVALCPHPLPGRTVLDAGAGTGAASAALAAAGARIVASDLSWDMLAWEAAARPPCAVADIRFLPFASGSVDDTVAAFVLNHLTDPAAGLAELVRVTRPRGAVLANVYSNASQSDVRDRIDQVAAEAGWRIPQWYLEVKYTTAPLLGTAADMEAAARAAGLVEVVVEERPVDVGITEAGQLVQYRFGQAQFAAWLDGIGPEEAAEVRRAAVEAIRPIMEPYRPIVVFLAARRPA
jgi:ubiquinone/menaquinone biosynthesis C-methylase UbiE